MIDSVMWPEESKQPPISFLDLCFTSKIKYFNDCLLSKHKPHFEHFGDNSFYVHITSFYVYIWIVWKY